MNPYDVVKQTCKSFGKYSKGKERKIFKVKSV